MQVARLREELGQECEQHAACRSELARAQQQHNQAVTSLEYARSDTFVFTCVNGFRSQCVPWQEAERRDCEGLERAN